MTASQVIIAAALTWLVLSSSYCYGWMIGRHTAPRPARVAHAPVAAEQSLRFVDLTDRPAPYDWATADSGLAACGLCGDTGRGSWVDSLTGSGIVGGVCPCGALPRIAR